MPSPTVTVTTLCRLELQFRAIPMPMMPGSSSDAWLAFTKRGVPSYSLPIAREDVERIQEFMVEHSTECLSDGNRTYTISGHALVACFPEAITPDMVRRYERT